MRNGFRYRIYYLIVFCIMLLFLSSCTYLKHASIQANYEKIQKTDPSLRNLKHMITRETYALYGKTFDINKAYDEADIALLAFSNRYENHELVDSMQSISVGTHFGLNLPKGNYQLVAVADLNEDSVYTQEEVIGRRDVQLNEINYAGMVVNVDLNLSDKQSVPWKFSIEVKSSPELTRSLFYPKDTIRSLDDSIFSDEMSTLGMYAPAAFLEKSPIYFYTLEENIGYKIPVIFVHGINGSPREFIPIIEKLDRERYAPWFFYYPSGGDLDYMADLFYKILLSGDVVPHDELVPYVIIAHSMGGLIVRQALNHIDNADDVHDIHFVSMATPFGGHPATVGAENSGLLVLPSWKDLNPNNEFIQTLYNTELPENVTHQLLYAFGDDSQIKFGENSDGVVPLSSQLFPAVQKNSTRQQGFNTTHTGILKDGKSLQYVVDYIHSVKTKIAEENMDSMISGGFDLPLDDVAGKESFTKLEKYLINNYSRLLVALIKNEIEPHNQPTKHFLAVIRRDKSPKYDFEKAWVKFVMRYPEYSQEQLTTNE